ncbi:MAG TPA: PQQ-binding-like beta-propeller repeat protein [Rhodanobacteraceae bacterium]|nr:PQQ-binding-like beta-propeller repeat protein [Rhodanobacteraceae bacterium]
MQTQMNAAWARSLAIAASCFVVPCHAQTAPWRSDWIVSAPPTLIRSGPLVRFGNDGDVLMAIKSFSQVGDSQVFRLAAAGAQRWIFNLEQDDITDLLPAADGGAFVATDFYGAIIKIAPDGTIGWTSQVGGKWLAQSNAGRIMTAGCNRITSLETELGAVVWQYRVAARTYPCALHGLVAGDDGAVYATFSPNPDDSEANGRVVKLDGSGHVLWQMSIDDAGSTPVGVDASILYVESADRLHAIDTATGSTVWRSEAVSSAFVLVPGQPAIPVAFGSSSLSGLDPASGAVRWTQPFYPVGVAGAAVIARSDSDLIGLGAADGDIEWSSVLPATDPFGNPVYNYYAAGGLAQGDFLAVARSFAYGMDPPPVVLRVDYASGQIDDTVAVPPSPQGVLDTSVATDERVYSAALAQAVDGTRVRVRAIDSRDGTTLWENTDLNLDPELANLSSYSNIDIAANTATVAVAIGEGNNQWSTATASEYTAVDGQARWRTDLRPPGEYWFQTYVSQPALDAASNLFEAVGTHVFCEPENQCVSQGLYKLSAVDGSIVWRFDTLGDRAIGGLLQLFPREFTLIGNDVLLDMDDVLVRLSGADGSIEWASDSITPDFISETYLADDGNIIVLGYHSWRKLDASTGTTLWSGDIPSLNCATQVCGIYDSLALPGSDLLQVGTVDGVPVAILLLGDGSGESRLWHPLPASHLQSYLANPGLDSSGRVWVRLVEREPLFYLGAGFLASLDLANGTLGGAQALTDQGYGVLARSPFYIALAPPENDRMLVSTYLQQAPAPTTQGAALLDTTVSAHGNLSLTTVLDPSPLMPGDIAHFVVMAHYDGDLPLTGVHLVMRTPWVLTSPDLDCIGVGADNCEGDLYTGDLRATFDINPGATISVNADVPVLDIDVAALVIDALVYGPTGLSEDNAIDNFAETAIAQSLFHDGFDSRSQ